MSKVIDNLQLSRKNSKKSNIQKKAYFKEDGSVGYIYLKIYKTPKEKIFPQMFEAFMDDTPGESLYEKLLKHKKE